MTAKGKITAARIAAGDRILVKHYNAENVADLSVLKYLGAEHALGISDTKTGAGVTVARVLKVEAKLVTGGRRDRRVYDIYTTEGLLAHNAPAQTMILAPEDAAGVKRAHVQALALDATYETHPLAIEDETLAEQAAASAETTLDVSSELAQTLVTADHEEALVEYAARESIDQTAAWLTRHDCDRATFENVQALIVKDHEEALVEYAARESIDQTAAWLTRHDCDRATFENVQALIVKDHEEALTLHSQTGKVDSMNNDASTDHLDIEITPSGAAKIAAHLAKTAPATPENHTGSTVVSLLEKVWARIRADHPELPEVVIITGSGLVGASKWGHFRAEGWKLREEGAAVRKHELFLAGEALAKGARQVLQTMLHEAAHTLAKVRSQQDTSRQGRWHNATFRKLAEEMGLEHKATQADKTHGFSFVTLTASTAEKYADLLEELDSEIRLVCHLPVWLGGEAGQDEAEGGEKITGKPKSGGETKSGPLKATCQCSEPLIIRLSQKVLDLGVVRCDECESLFQAA